MRFSRLLLPAFVLFLSHVSALAQNKPAQCLVTCEPDSTSGSYGATYAVRPQSKNARSTGSVLSVRPAGLRSEDVSSQSGPLAGSESYSYAIPIVSLPGRNGLDLNLALFYNSALWTIDTVNGTVTLNSDRDFPSYGFRLGFGLIEAPPSGSTSYLLTEPDGTKRELKFSFGSTYVTVDSSYIDWNSSTRVLRRKDGTQWTYERVGTTVFYRPIKILDTNGNYISIVYSTASGADKQAIATITDTIGRVVTFNYDTATNPKLQNITVTAPGGASRTVATFGWNSSYILNYRYSLTVFDTPANGSSTNVLTSCSYPAASGSGTGLSYEFTYGDWAIVRQITRKSATGAVRSYVRYDFPPGGASDPALSDHPTYQHEYVSPDGTTESAWSYAVTKTSGVTSSFAVTDPATGTVTTTNLYTSGWQTGLVSTVTVANGSTTYRTISNTWTQDNTSQSTPLNPRLLSTSTTLNDSGQTATVSFTYGANGNVTDVSESDFGTDTVRKTHTDYLTTSPYTSLHILDRPSKIQVYDGANNLKSRTDFTYDGGTLTSVTTAPQHDNANYGSSFTTRGNVTSTTRYKNAAAGTGPITRNFTYDTLGNLLTAQVDCCQSKQWSFSSTTGFAYPDSVTRGSGGTQLSSSWIYDLLTGLVSSQTDENSQVMNYFYDNLNRPTSVAGPLNISVTYSYDDNSAQPSLTQTTALDTGKSRVQITTGDGLGRAVKQETRDAAGQNSSIVETQYDSAGRVSQVSLPHASGASPSWTVNQYDVLGRVVKVIPPDGSQTSNNTQFLYTGNAVTVTDPAGKQRRSYTDALGRLTQVHEPGWGDATAGQGSVTINGTLQSICVEPAPPPQTCGGYQYDSGTVQVTVGSFTASVNYSQFLNNTATKVANALASQLNGTGSPVTASVSGSTISLTARQTGGSTNYALSWSSASSDPGSFPVPSFSGQRSGPRLTGGTDAATPDAPTLDHPMPSVYSYDALDNLTLVVQGVQQRQFVYDSLARLTSATTPEAGAVTYTFSDYGLVLTRTDARGVVTNYSYDSLNRLTQVNYNVGTTGVPTTPMVTFTYGTNPGAFNNGRLITMTDGAGSEAYVYDALGRLTQLTKTIAGTAYPVSYAYDFGGSLKQITYPSGRIVTQSLDTLGRLNQVSSGGTNYVSGIGYNAAWQPTGFSYGNGVAASFGYNARMQLASLAYTKTGSTLLSLNYDYTVGVPGNNGQIQRITDNVDATRTTTYVYDAWSRLKQATNSQWTVNETYDRYGNRLTQSAPVANSVTVNAATNRITDPGYAYDASGNMTSDGLNTLVYDGENRVVSNTQAGATTSYTFDGNNLRVKKCAPNCTSPTSSTVYIFSGAKVIAEYDNGAGVASPSREYIYTGSQLVATLAGATTTYHQADHLSLRVNTDTNGVVSGTQGHFPFGESWYSTSSTTKWKFTSYERDPESSNDYAMMRSYVNRLARFSSPDPVAGSLGDPQSLNRYAYTRNDSVNLSDPLGLTLACGFTCQNLNAFFPYFSVTVFGDFAGFVLGGGGRYFNKPNKMLEQDAGAPPDIRPELDPNAMNRLLNLPILGALQTLQDLLKNDPDCLAFLNGAGGDALQTLATIINLGLYGQDVIVPRPTGRGTYSIINAQNAATPATVGAAIVVNSIGAFFHDSWNGLPLSTNNGRLQGDTSGARVFILLHELGHHTNALESDYGNDKAGKRNNNRLNKACEKTIKAAR